MNNFIKIEKEYSCVFPDDFKKFLTEWNQDKELIVKNQLWKIADFKINKTTSESKFGLNDHIMHGFPFYRVLCGIDKEVGGIDSFKTSDFFAFGLLNGDYLLINPSDNFSIWSFWHDGSSLKKTYNSFSDFYSKVKIHKKYSGSDELDLSLVGRWVPFECKTLTIKCFSTTVLEADGSYQSISSIGMVSENNWSTKRNGDQYQLILKGKKQDFIYEVIDKTNGSLILKGPEPNQDIVSYKLNE